MNLSPDERLAVAKRDLAIARVITAATDDLLDGVRFQEEDLEQNISEFKGMQDVPILEQLLALTKEFNQKVSQIDSTWTAIYAERNTDVRRYAEEAQQAKAKGYPAGVFVSRSIAKEIWATIYRHNGAGIWLANNEKMTNLSQIPEDLIPLVAVDNQPESE